MGKSVKRTNDLQIQIVRSSVLEQAVDGLRSAILSGKFQPGERLVEADLCAMMGISRASLREALRRLEAERLIDIVLNRGPVISVVSWEEALEIYKVRGLLEAEAAALAARHATPADNALIAGALADFNTALATGDAGEQVASASRFYDALLQCAGNTIIGELLSGLRARISFLRGKSMSLDGRGQSSAKEMAAIAQAIAENDEAGARAAATAHIEAACQAAARVYAQVEAARSA